MKAWVLRKHTDPQHAFVLEQVKDPVPGPQQVRIRVEAFGLNFADVMASRGLYREAPPLPSIIGYEVVGRVDGIGAKVPPEWLGKRVVGLTRFGGYAQLACVDHRAVQELADEVPAGEALALGTQGCTAMYMTRYARPLSKGMRVLVHSAAGGVGNLLVQLAVHASCEVYAVASGKEKAELLRQLGAHHVIDRNAGDTHQQLRTLLGEKRLDVSFNAVGGSTFKQDMRLVGSGGSVVLYGGAERSGISTFSFLWRMGLLIPIFLMMKSKSIIGVNMLKIGDHRPELMAACLQFGVRAMRDGVLHPKVHRMYTSAELPAALESLASGKTIGKVGVCW